MFKNISIIGLGPHRDFQATCDPGGITLLSGRSEAGKSFVVEAILLALWGQSSTGSFRPEAIHDDFSKAVVELTLEDGRIIRRSVTRTRSTTRVIITAGERQVFANEADFQAAIGPLGGDVEILRTIMLPMAWQPLVAANARKFRDLLGRLLPPGDVAADIRLRMTGHEVSDAEIGWTDAEAMTHRRNSRKVRDEAAGRRDSAHERVAGLQATEAPRPAAIDSGPVEAARLWEDYDRQLGSGAGAQARQAEWDRQRQALGEAPMVDPLHAEAQPKATEAQRASAIATQTYQEVYGRYQAATVQQQTFGALPDPSTCPMCQRPGWEQGAEMAAQAQATVMTVQQEFMTAQQAHQQAHANLALTTKALDAAREATTARASWDRSIAALGQRPEAPNSTEVEPPAVPRPDPEAVSMAREAERAAIAAGGARARWATELEAAKAAVVTETERHRVADDEEKRSELLLQAIRAAPSAVAERQAQALGDLGPVALVFGDNPAVTVLIDGRPFWLASRGRQVVADVWLRAGMRRASGLESLPLAVDNVQDVGGQPLPDMPPAIHMRTTDEDKITVSFGAS